MVLLSVFAVLGVAILGAIQTSHFAKGRFDVQSDAENIVRNQLEYVFGKPYVSPGEGSYPSITEPDSGYILPEGYEVAVEVLAVSGEPPSKISTIEVTVTRNSEVVRVFETLRANHRP